MDGRTGFGRHNVKTKFINRRKGQEIVGSDDRPCSEKKRYIKPTDTKRRPEVTTPKLYEYNKQDKRTNLNRKVYNTSKII